MNRPFNTLFSLLRRASPVVLGLCLLTPLGWASAQDGLADAGTGTGDAPSHHASRQAARDGLEERVKMLTTALDLDAKQQAELRKVLEGQREQVAKVWSDASLPAAYRIRAMQAISDRTADQIRALLSEEQRKKYNPPRLRPDDGAPRPDVARWMSATLPGGSAPSTLR
jgi:hypothetical protein